MLRRRSFWAAWVATWAVALCARAQPAASPNAARPEYERQVALGVEEFNLGHYEEAQTRFLAAHAAYPNARSLRALGTAAYELRQYAEATRYLEQALTSSVRPLSPRMIEEAQALLRNAREYIGEYTLLLHPADAKLWLDGERWTLAAGEPLRLAVGEHELMARASDHDTLRRRLHVKGGTRTRLDLQLTRAAPSKSLSQGEADSRADEPVHKRRRRALWVSLASIVLGAAVAGVVVATRPPEVVPSPAGAAATILVPPGG